MESQEAAESDDKKSRSLRGKIVIDPVTGFPALTAGEDAPVLTSEQVAEILADFP